jgi:methyl-accepting chemotaxis protein
VTSGIHLAQQAGEIIRQLSEVIGGSAQSARMIATASRQLSAGIEQISSAMGELTSLTGGIVVTAKNADAGVRALIDHVKALQLIVDELKRQSRPDSPGMGTPTIAERTAG